MPAWFLQKGELESSDGTFSINSTYCVLTYDTYFKCFTQLSGELGSSDGTCFTIAATCVC